MFVLPFQGQNKASFHGQHAGVQWTIVMSTLNMFLWPNAGSLWLTSLGPTSRRYA